MASRHSPPPAYTDGQASTVDGVNAKRPEARPRSIDLTLGAGARMSGAPLSPVRISSPEKVYAAPSSAHIETYAARSRRPSGDAYLPQNLSPTMLSPTNFSRPTTASQRPLSPLSPNRTSPLPDSLRHVASPPPPPPPKHGVRLVGVSQDTDPYSKRRAEQPLPKSWAGVPQLESPQIVAVDESGNPTYFPNMDGQDNAAKTNENEAPEEVPQLQYFHNRGLSDTSDMKERRSEGNSGFQTPDSRPQSSGNLLARPVSAMMLDGLSRSPSPGQSPSRSSGARASPYGRKSAQSARPKSYIDLLNAPYPQPAPAAGNMNNDALRPAVGLSASLLSSQQTFEMYLANVKKTADSQVQYSFAIFLISMAQEARSKPSTPGAEETPLSKPQSLVHEAQKIFENLAGKSYPFAQYYLADGLTSGLFTKNGEPDHGRALDLFVAASKHGHAEAGYRAGLCYEFGWGTRRDGPKAEQYFRASASRSHPGAMARLSRACLTGDLGLPISQREGVRWLRRAADAADAQFNAAPYELGLLHEHGFGDDVFKDPSYAAQMFTRSAELGHGDAAFRMGEAYEHATLGCPRDPGLSIHFYNSAATRGHSGAMLGLTAWYMLGAGDLLQKDETEAFEWAKRAAAEGNPKGLFTVGWFRETGTGCRRDPLEANVCYVKAADLGDERARHRIKAISVAASGGGEAAARMQKEEREKKEKVKKEKERKENLQEEERKREKEEKKREKKNKGKEEKEKLKEREKSRDRARDLSQGRESGDDSAGDKEKKKKKFGLF